MFNETTIDIDNLVLIVLFSIKNHELCMLNGAVHSLLEIVQGLIQFMRNSLNDDLKSTE